MISFVGDVCMCDKSIGEGLALDPSRFEAPTMLPVGQMEELKIWKGLKLDPSHA